MLYRLNDKDRKALAMKMGMHPTGQQNKFQLHNDTIYEKKLVHRFSLSDVEDPELYAALPISEWQQTEKGKWVMQHGLDPTYHIHADYLNYGYQVAITAGITPKRWTEFVLRGWDQY